MILIKLRRRLLVIAAVGAALIVAATAIVTLKGNDTPSITTNPPAEDELPTDAPVTPAEDNDVPETSPSDDYEPDEDDDTGDSEPEVPGDDDTGPGDDDTTPSDDAKARGLARAIEVHERNMAKMAFKGKTAPPGLHMSMESLEVKYAAMLANEQASLDHKDNGKHKGQMK